VPTAGAVSVRAVVADPAAAQVYVPSSGSRECLRAGIAVKDADRVLVSAVGANARRVSPRPETLQSIARHRRTVGTGRPGCDKDVALRHDLDQAARQLKPISRPNANLDR
jgi:hypothetical protein